MWVTSEIKASGHCLLSLGLRPFDVRFLAASFTAETQAQCSLLVESYLIWQVSPSLQGNFSLRVWAKIAPKQYETV